MQLHSVTGGASFRATAVFLLATYVLAAQDFSSLPVEQVASGFPGGEGPVWSRQGFLIFSDYGKDLSRVNVSQRLLVALRLALINATNCDVYGKGRDEEQIPTVKMHEVFY